MIRMSGEINLLESIGEIDNSSIEISPTKNNISANISDIIGVRKNGTNPFLFGISKLGSGATFSNGEDYFIGSVAADENGDFETNYVLTFNIYISSEEFNSSQNKKLNFTLVFDTYNTAYAKNIIVSWGHGYTIGILQKETVNKTNNSPVFVFNSNAEITSNGMHWVSITIQDWSMPNYPLRLQGIYTGLSLYFDKRNLISLSAPIKDRSDNEQPSYGIISNAGTLTIIDGTREIEEYARLGLLKPDLDVQLLLEDTLTVLQTEPERLYKRQSIGKFKTDKWSYDDMNFQVTVDLKDDLEQMQEINVPNQFELYYFNDSHGNIVVEDKTAYYIYTQLKNLTTMNEFWDEPSDFIAYLNRFTVKNYYLSKGSLWEQWNKFCNFIQAQMYEQDKKIKFTYNIG